MQKHFSRGLLVLAGSFLLGSCSLTPTEETNYYKVSFYSDYVGIEGDVSAKTLDVSKAQLIGHAYVNKTSPKKISAPTKYENHGTEESPSYLDYHVSQRTAPTGYDYSFSSWIGFYEDGKTINLESVTADCAVFANFDAIIKNYSVKVTVEGNNLYSSFVPHGMTIVSADATKALTADPISASDDPYYKTTPFLGWDVFVGDSKTAATRLTTYTQVNTYPIVDKTTFKAVFDSDHPTYASYEVNYSCGYYDAANAYHAIAGHEGSVTVEYNHALTPETISGYTYKKSEGSYGTDAPTSLADRTVDIEHIRYDASVVLIYEPETVTHTVTFYQYQGGAYVVGKTITVGDGEDLPTSYRPAVEADKSFTGYWLVDSTSGSRAPITVTSDLSLYPEQVDSVVVDNKTDYDLQYRFSLSAGGYLLDGFRRTNLAVPSFALAAADFSSNIQKGFGMAGVASFNNPFPGETSSPNDQKLITSVSLPDTVNILGISSFNSLTGITELDLSGLTHLETIETQAFSNCTSLVTAKLPASIMTAESNLFLNDTALTTITISLSPSEIAKRNFSSSWYYTTRTGAPGVTVGFAM